jgi:hypothetical protein
MTRHAWAGIVFILTVGILGLGQKGFGGHHPTVTAIAGLVIILGLYAMLRVGRTRV